MAQPKTNAMRKLESAGIEYSYYTYDTKDGLLDGVSVAAKVGKPAESVYKTLVTKSGAEPLVFVVPVACELDMKKAARAMGVKSVEMAKLSDITPLTGYVKGGCSPVGMKKQYRTVIDETAQALSRIVVSAGKIGGQIELPPLALAELIGAAFADIVKENTEA